MWRVPASKGAGVTASPRHLLAKSTEDVEHPPGQVTLRGHTMLVCEAADRLLVLRGSHSLASAGLDSSCVDRLTAIVRVAAFAHDLGKCSAHFQAMLRGHRQAQQLVRHEALSLWLVWPGQPLSQWIRSGLNDWDLMIAATAAAGHHRKFWRNAIATDDSGAGTSLELFTDHSDFRALLSAGARRLGLPDAPILERIRIEVGRRRSILRDLERWEIEWQEHASQSAQDDKLAALAKAMVVAADVAGSALPKADQRVSWIDEQLARRASSAALQAVVDTRLAGSELRPFQLHVARSTANVTFIRAGCGSGKTVAAYLWAARQHAGRQLWVTYPTTGTTTEGYRDYVAMDPDLESRLEHGRREIDIEIFDLPDDHEYGRARDRLDALRSWGSEAIVCTVDTVLGLVQAQRKGLYAWPGLAHAAIVFDEIHAYDDALFGALLRFLEAMPGTPALLMTASLPASRMAALQSLVARVHGGVLLEISGPPELEALPRYVRSDREPIEAVREVLDTGGKVLWVSNTVDRCIAVADRVPEATVYHSRFRYIDRVKRHAAVIAAFRDSEGCIATTTQVAEMSLDLSADLLVTELAPIPALIQRLGRLNRRATVERPGTPRPFIILPVERALPYDSEQLTEAQSWLSRLGWEPLSQADLVAAWTSSSKAITARVVSSWLDGGFSTFPAALREASVGLTVLRESDVAEVRARPERATALAIPMNQPPRRHAWRSWPQVAYLPVAPTSVLAYDPERGASWT